MMWTGTWLFTAGTWRDGTDAERARPLIMSSAGICHLHRDPDDDGTDTGVAITRPPIRLVVVVNAPPRACNLRACRARFCGGWRSQALTAAGGPAFFLFVSSGGIFFFPPPTARSFIICGGSAHGAMARGQTCNTRGTHAGAVKNRGADGHEIPAHRVRPKSTRWPFVVQCSPTQMQAPDQALTRCLWGALIGGAQPSPDATIASYQVGVRLMALWPPDRRSGHATRAPGEYEVPSVVRDDSRGAPLNQARDTMFVTINARASWPMRGPISS